MKRFFPVIMFGILQVMSPVLAQTQPSRAQTQPVVLNALSERVGVPNLQLSSLVNWNWFFGTYEFVVGQGCVGAPAAAAEPGGTGKGWQRYVLNYKGVEYIYLISDDAQYLVLCNEAALGTPVPSVTPAPAQPATNTPPPLVMMTSTPVPVSTPVEDSCPLLPRLSLGLARVLPGEPNWLHDSPARSSTKIGEIPGDAEFTVLSGPVCDARTGMNYWQVRYDTLTGWTSEGLDGVYWLEKIDAGIPPFLVENAANAAPAPWVAASFPAGIREIALSRDTTIVALIDLNGRVSLFDTALGAALRNVPADSSVTHVAISHDGRYVVTAYPDSSVFVWEVGSAQPAGYAVHSGDITAMAFSPVDRTDRVLAVANKEGQIWLWDTPLLAPETLPLAMLEASGAVASLEFNTQATMLIARDTAGAVVGIWQIPTI